MATILYTPRNKRAVADALALLTDPAACRDNPGKRLMAFAILKAARGQRMVQSRICRIAGDAQQTAMVTAVDRRAQ